MGVGVGVGVVEVGGLPQRLSATGAGVATARTPRARKDATEIRENIFVLGWRGWKWCRWLLAALLRASLVFIPADDARK